MVTLKNGNSVLSINEKGAEMKSFLVNGVEYLWVGDPKFWASSTPNLFPMTGGFKDDKYILNGKEYFMPKHGFAKNMDFEVEAQTENTATFLLKSNEETKVGFPFDFELRVSYILTEGKVTASYSVKNLSDDTMWFSIGSHDGFATPEGIEEYDVIFPQKETLDTYTLFGNLLSHDTTPVIKDSDRIALNYNYFAIDALVFKDLKSRTCRLHNRKTGRGIQLDFPGCPRFVLWTKPNAPYLCIEPWFGQADNVDSDYDITHKEAIESLEAGKTFNATRVITALEGK
ncbi:MAG: aldose 1-epimerase family protein [Clostridia bacterium]|nr:aldose 1-epimerase family protein [Clostridia bacterium]